MRIKNKITALILAITVAFSVSVSTIAVSAENQSPEIQLTGLNDYKQKIWDEGLPVFSTNQFLKIINTINNVVRALTGQWMITDSHYNVVVDEFVTNACNYVFENCCLDIVSILTNVPNLNGIAEITTKVFNIDTVEFRNQMLEKSKEYYHEGNTFLSGICDFLASYMSIIDLCEVYSEPTDNPAVYQVLLRITYRDGGTFILHPGIYINTETGECTNINDNGLVNTGFNFSLSEMMVYATINCWMREFGFCVFYDIAANSFPLLWHYDTRRFTFDYNGLEWMIQIWKGNYLITNGGEVGLYNRTPDKSGTFYNCATDEQMLEMSLQIYHGENLLVNQEPQMHWWVNGFNMSDRLYLPQSLTMKFSIAMPDEDMLNAFCNAIDNHYKHDVTYTTDGLKIDVIW